MVRSADGGAALERVTVQIQRFGSGLVDQTNTAAEAQKEYRKGLAALQEKKSEKALSYLTKAVSLFPAFFDAQLLVGTTYMDLEQ